MAFFSFGICLGTLGRAHLHALQFARAEHPLREALAHHLASFEKQAARSYCHLATCLRLLGRTSDALLALERGFAIAHKYSLWPEALATLLYLGLEQGRCWLAQGEPMLALSSFEAPATSETDYPRVSALRGMAEAQRSLGDREGAYRLTLECAAIAGRSSGVLARVAMMAVGDALLAVPNGEHATSLAASWATVFPLGDLEFIAQTTKSSIY